MRCAFVGHPSANEQVQAFGITYAKLEAYSNMGIFARMGKVLIFG
jgi:hypothetical protein